MYIVCVRAAYQKAVREQKLAAEISAAKRERDFYLSRVDRAKAEAAQAERKRKVCLSLFWHIPYHLGYLAKGCCPRPTATTRLSFGLGGVRLGWAGQKGVRFCGGSIRISACLVLQRQQKEEQKDGVAAASGGAPPTGAAEGPPVQRRLLRTFGQKRARVDPASEDAPTIDPGVLALIAGKKK